MEDDVLNYQSVKPYEKRLWDKSVIKNSKVKNVKNKSIKEKSKKSKSVVMRKGNITSTQGVPLSKKKVSWKSMVSRKSASKKKPVEKKSVSIWNSFKKSAKNAIDLNSILENLKKPMEHFGPVNMNFVMKINPKDMLIRIYQSLANQSVKVDKIDNFKLECSLKGKPFQIEIMQLDLFKDYSAMRFYRNKINTQDALDL